uniref:3-phosphoshikimate 1-carboxyvinyltransferase n=1 Tax=Candidatus Cryptobacteroides bacterium TaxID=3085639 RepID=UPI004028F019
MICTTIQNKTIDEIYAILESGNVEMAEIRLDSCPLTMDEIEELFSTSDVPLVATCRINAVKERLSQTLAGHTQDDRKLEMKASQEVESKLITAIHAGAAFVDLEIEAPPMMSKRLRRETRENGTVFVRSYHDYKGTDSIEALKALTEKCFAIGADIAKIVTMAAQCTGDNQSPDVDRVLSLYDHFDPAKLIAFAMGDAGKTSRIQCLAKGSPFTYASLNEEDTAAPGQMTTREMRDIVYGNCVNVNAAGTAANRLCAGSLNAASLQTADATGASSDIDNGPGAAEIQMPSSKSFAQRAIIAAALAEGTTTLNGYSPCGDNESAISVARALGAEVTVGLAYKEGKVVKDSSTLTIKGRGAAALEPETINAGESGLLARLMIPLMAVLGDGNGTVTGEGTLTRRPLKGARDIMGAFGVRFETISGTGQESFSEVHVPLTISGKLEGGKVTVSGSGGSQLISGLLMALPLLQEDTVIRLTEPKSIPYLFITMDVLKAFGVKIWCDMEGGPEFAESQDWNDCTEIVLHIKGGQSYKATDMDIEGDWSSAANFLVAGAIFGKVNVSGLDTKSLQADLSIMDILMEAGASLSQMGDDDPRGVIHVQKAPLNAFDVDANNCPDLFPIVAILAAFCQGTSRIAGVGRLANKESDRAQAILSMLVQLGVKSRISGDKMIIEGHSLAQRCLTGHLLKGGNYTSSHDHRMVMALKVAELGADGPIVIDDIECVSKSFPTFMELFGKL